MLKKRKTSRTSSTCNESSFGRHSLPHNRDHLNLNRCASFSLLLSNCLLACCLELSPSMEASGKFLWFFPLKSTQQFSGQFRLLHSQVLHIYLGGNRSMWINRRIMKIVKGKGERSGDVKEYWLPWIFPFTVSLWK